MPDLDPVLRQLKANVALRLRREARDLDREAAQKCAQASAIESTWDLVPQYGPEPLLIEPDREDE